MNRQTLKINKWYRFNNRLFYQSIKSFNHNYTKIEMIDCKSSNQFYDKIIEIKNIDKFVIFQSHKDYQFSSKLLNKIYNSNSFDQISFEQLYNGISISLKNKIKIEKKIPVYIFKFSFKTADLLPSIFSSFFIPFSLQNGSLQEKYQFQKNKFSEYYSECNELCLDGETCVLLFFNSDNFTELTIKHELCHYFQFIQNKKYQLEQDLQLQYIKQLQLNKQQLKYLLDQKQFQSHIKVNLIQQLQQIYYKFFMDKSKQQYIDLIIQTIKQNPLHVIDNFLKYLVQCKNTDTTSLRLFASCYIFRNKKYLSKALNWIYQSFK